MIRRAVALVGMTAGALVVAAAPAFAHIEVEPARVKPGRSVTVEFSPEHGCGEDSPTTRMTFRVPRGVRDATGVAPDGWTATTSGRRIIFEGGPLPYDEDEDFGISFRAPDAKTVLTWKLVQTCEDGSVRWIEADHDAEYPAPVVGVGMDPPAGSDD